MNHISAADIRCLNEATYLSASFNFRYKFTINCKTACSFCNKIKKNIGSPAKIEGKSIIHAPQKAL